MTIHVDVVFVDDHKDQIHLWTEFRTRYALGEEPDVPNICNRMLHDLQAHFKHEELLYATYRNREGDLAKLILLIREQHNSLITLLQGMIDGDFEGETLKEKIAEFESLLYTHIALEEKQLYPELDRALDEKTKERVIEDLKIDTTHKEII